MYSTLKNSLLILMVLPCFCLGQEYDLLKELDSLDQNQDSFQLPAFKALQIGNLQSTKVIDKGDLYLSLIHISEPTRQAEISYAVFCLQKKNRE